MTFEFRPAARENVWLLLGVAGGTGSGKTFSAMRLARGLAGDKPFAVIDTEAGRAKHYADQFRFDWGDLSAPFSPERYLEAIVEAERAGYGVIVVDSMSHEHSGDGGLLDLQEVELTRMAGDDWKKRDACRMASWVKPKGSHKKMMSRLLQLRAHLILCFRAESKVEMVKGQDGKWVVEPKKSLTGLNGWIPICEKNLPYELTASFLLTSDAPGIPKPIKLQEQHRAFFPLTQPITEQAGLSLAQWSRGGNTATEQPPTQPAPEFIDQERKDWLRKAFTEALPTKYKAHAEQLFNDSLRIAGYALGVDTIKTKDFKKVAKEVVNQAATIEQLASA